MVRIALLVLALGAAALADVEALLRRAEVRQANDNRQGARELLQQAVEEDPSCAAALAKLAALETEEETRYHFQYLLQGAPLDAKTAAGVLHELRDRVIDVPEALYPVVERATLLPSEDTDEVDGPLQPWDWPAHAPPAKMPAGPLRCEAFGSPAHSHRERLRAVAARLDREGIQDAACWAELAALQRRVGDADASEASLARARPVTLEERLIVAECSLRAVSDPLSWWRAHGEEALEEAQRAGLLEEDDAQPVSRLFATALDVLVDAHDVRGLVPLLRREASLSPAGASPFARAAEAIDRAWSLDEAAQALRGDTDPAASSLRAALLYEMLQEDRAIEALEETLAAHPDDLGLWTEAWRFHRSVTCWPKEYEAARRVISLAREGSRPLAPEFCGRFVTLLREMEGEGQAAEWTRGRLQHVQSLRELHELSVAWKDRADGPLLADLLATADRLKAWGVEGWDSDVSGPLCPLLAYAGMERQLLQRVALLPEGKAWGVAPGVYFRSCERLVRACAALTTITPAQDVFLRTLLLGRLNAFDKDRDASAVRVRMDCEGDVEFLRLPSAPYLLSLLQDPVFQYDRAAELRRAAYRGGCRARGLLRDMARDGEAVQDIEPGNRLLAEGVRTGQVALLRRALEEDDTCWMEIVEARSEIQRVTDRIVNTDTGVGDPLGEAARSLWGTSGCAAPAREAWKRLMNPTRAGMLVLHATAGQQPDAVRVELQRSFQRLADAAPFAMEIDVIGGKLRFLRCREVRPLLEPQQVDTELVRAAEARHPLDLRWVAIEHGSHSSRRATWDVRPERLAPIALYRSRNPDAVLRGLERCKGEKEAQETLDRFLQLQQGEPLKRLMRDLRIGSFSGAAMKLVEPFARELLKRCATDEERGEVSSFAQWNGSPQLSSEWDVALTKSADAQVRLNALQRERARKVEPKDCRGLREFAVRWEGNEDVGGRLWKEVAREALAADDEALVVEAFGRLWKEYPFTPDVGRDDQRLPKEMAYRHIGEGESAIPLFYYMFGYASDDKERGPLLAAWRILYDHGIAPRQWLLEQVKAAPRGEPLALLRTLHEPPSWFVRHLAASLAEGNRPDEADACVDDWVARFGDRACAGDSPYRGGSHNSFPSPADGETAPSVARDLLAATILIDASDLQLGERGCLHKAVVQHLEDAWTRTPDVAVIEACRAAEAEMLRWAKREGEAVPHLLWLLNHAGDRESRHTAHESLKSLYEQMPSTHALFVEDLLARSADLPAPERAEVAAWQGRLTSPDVAERDRATDDLRAQGRLAVPLLRELRIATDAEARARAEQVLDELASP